MKTILTSDDFKNPEEIRKSRNEQILSVYGTSSEELFKAEKKKKEKEEEEIDEYKHHRLMAGFHSAKADDIDTEALKLGAGSEKSLHASAKEKKGESTRHRKLADEHRERAKKLFDPETHGKWGDVMPTKVDVLRYGTKQGKDVDATATGLEDEDGQDYKGQKEKLKKGSSEDIEKAEGAKGGKVISHTKGGKPIYETASHKAAHALVDKYKAGWNGKKNNWAGTGELSGLHTQLAESHNEHNKDSYKGHEGVSTDAEHAVQRHSEGAHKLINGLEEHALKHILEHHHVEKSDSDSDQEIKKVVEKGGMGSGKYEHLKHFASGEYQDHVSGAAKKIMAAHQELHGRLQEAKQKAGNALAPGLEHAYHKDLKAVHQGTSSPGSNLEAYHKETGGNREYAKELHQHVKSYHEKFHAAAKEAGSFLSPGVKAAAAKDIVRKSEEVEKVEKGGPGSGKHVSEFNANELRAYARENGINHDQPIGKLRSEVLTHVVRKNVEDFKKRKGVEKAMSAGSTTGTDTTNKNSTYEAAKEEDVEGKKNEVEKALDTLGVDSLIK